jgi:hypothetical protein
VATVIRAATPHTAANAKKIRIWAKGRSALKHFQNNLDKLDLVPSQRKPAGASRPPTATAAAEQLNARINLTSLPYPSGDWTL